MFKLSILIVNNLYHFKRKFPQYNNFLGTAASSGWEIGKFLPNILSHEYISIDMAILKKKSAEADQLAC